MRHSRDRGFVTTSASHADDVGKIWIVCFLQGLAKQREKKDQVCTALRWNTSSTFMGPWGPSCSHDVPMFDSFAAISQTKTSGAAEAIGHVLSKHRILGEFTMYSEFEQQNHSQNAVP